MISSIPSLYDLAENKITFLHTTFLSDSAGPTSKMKSTLFFSITSLLAGVRAASYHVTVGPGLSFSPDTISNAQEGDIVQFKFGSGHDVVSGTFGKAVICRNYLLDLTLGRFTVPT